MVQYRIITHYSLINYILQTIFIIILIQQLYLYVLHPYHIHLILHQYISNPPKIHTFSSHQIIIFIFFLYYYHQIYYMLSFLFIALIKTNLISISQLPQYMFIQQIQPYIPQCKTSKTNLNHLNTQYLQIHITSSTQNILPPPFQPTPVFAYACQAINPFTSQNLGFIQSVPGPTIKVNSNQYLTINFTNLIPGNHLFQIDWSLLMDPYNDIDPQTIKGVPTIVHVHGQIVQSYSDGFPSSFTTFYGSKGPTYNSTIQTTNNSFVFRYPNLLKQATLFYHDHSIGITRLNNYAGLSGMYIIQSKNITPLNIINMTNDIILMIQDKTFYENGSLYYPDHWVDEFFGDTIIVNGKIWPQMKISTGLYRLRLLNACGTRFLNVSFQHSNNSLIQFEVVKADSQYLDQSYGTNFLMIFPGERYQILINFTGTVGDQIYVINNELTDLFIYNPVDLKTTAFIMRFKIIQVKNQNIEVKLPITNKNRYILQNPIQRFNTVIISDKNQYNVSIGSFFDGCDFSVKYKTFQISKVYQFYIINLMEDPHPLHFHLAQFQLYQRYSFDSFHYQIDFQNLNGPMPYKSSKAIKYPNIQQYNLSLIGKPTAYQLATRDIIQVFPNSITVIRLMFSLPDGSEYPIKVSQGPGFIIQCHILEHQDHSLMGLFTLRDKEMQKIEMNNGLNSGMIIGISLSILSIIIILILILYRLKKKYKNAKQQNSQLIDQNSINKQGYKVKKVKKVKKDKKRSNRIKKNRFSQENYHVSNNLIVSKDDSSFIKSQNIQKLQQSTQQI